MEAAVVFAFVGALVGVVAAVAWASIAAIFDLSIVTERQFLGVLGLGVVFGEIVGWGIILREELRS